jgi:ArsR family transcriptional regulator, lead/cadmium/zinc/bismuth-responsive transcriptional repressor
MNKRSYDKPALSSEQNTLLAEVFRLLGDPTRLRIVFACLDRTIAVGDIAAELTLSPSLVSHHLRLLRGAHVVRAERQGKNVLYSAADEHVRAVLVAMAAHIHEPSSADDAGEDTESYPDAARG